MSLFDVTESEFVALRFVCIDCLTSAVVGRESSLGPGALCVVLVCRGALASMLFRNCRVASLPSRKLANGRHRGTARAQFFRA